MLEAFVLIRIKSSQDILQGLSKLDHLLKMSKFQKFKPYSNQDPLLLIGSARLATMLSGEANRGSSRGQSQQIPSYSCFDSMIADNIKEI